MQFAKLFSALLLTEAKSRPIKIQRGMRLKFRHLEPEKAQSIEDLSYGQKETQKILSGLDGFILPAM